jgi:hypothetical protein
MDQRLQFVHDALSERFEMTELCIRYDVSRKIGYKWLARFEAEGKAGLANRSRRPHTCPTAIRPALAELLCEFRRLHPDWACGSSSRCSAVAIRRSRTGRRPVRPPTYSHAAASCGGGGAVGRTNIPASSRSRRHNRTTAGPRISKASSAPGTACTAIRSRSPIGTRARFLLSCHD